jgi:hypothetical protein
MQRGSRSGFRFDRLRPGEWLMGLAGLALLIDLVALPWYSLSSTFSSTSAQFGAPTSATGFEAHHLLGPLALLCALLAMATWGLQGTQRAPALPVCVSAICATVTFALAIALVVRVAFDPPNVLVRGAPGVDTIQTDVGAVVGLLLAWVMVIGSWISLRTEGIAPADGPPKVQRLVLRSRSAST